VLQGCQASRLWQDRMTRALRGKIYRR
jgi:hypothetical protein